MVYNFCWQLYPTHLPYETSKPRWQTQWWQYGRRTLRVNVIPVLMQSHQSITKSIRSFLIWVSLRMSGFHSKHSCCNATHWWKKKHQMIIQLKGEKHLLKLTILHLKEYLQNRIRKEGLHSDKWSLQKFPHQSMYLMMKCWMFFIREPNNTRSHR